MLTNLTNNELVTLQTGDIYKSIRILEISKVKVSFEEYGKVKDVKF